MKKKKQECYSTPFLRTFKMHISYTLLMDTFIVVKVKTKHDKKLILSTFSMEATFGEEDQRDGAWRFSLIKDTEN